MSASPAPALAPHLRELLQHSLGLNDRGRGKMYRNHFVAGGDDVAKCRDLVARGLMQEHDRGELCGILFTVTAAGIDEARNV